MGRLNRHIGPLSLSKSDLRAPIRVHGQGHRFGFGLQGPCL